MGMGRCDELRRGGEVGEVRGATTGTAEPRNEASVAFMAIRQWDSRERNRNVERRGARRGVVELRRDAARSSDGEAGGGTSGGPDHPHARLALDDRLQCTNFFRIQTTMLVSEMSRW